MTNHEIQSHSSKANALDSTFNAIKNLLCILLIAYLMLVRMGMEYLNPQSLNTAYTVIIDEPNCSQREGDVHKSLEI